MSEQGHSPTPPEPEQKTVNFAIALEAMVAGNKITKLEWGNERVVGWLDSILKWKDEAGIEHQWILNDGDILGEDWVILHE